MSDEIEIVDGASDRKYFAMIPNMVSDSGLSPYAVTLYVRLKRRAGEAGECWESSRNLADACCMSRSQIGRAKLELQTAGLITITRRQAGHGHFPGHVITINDVWALNLARYAAGSESASPVPGRAASCPYSGPRPVPGAVHKNNPVKKMPNGNEKKSGATTCLPAKTMQAGDNGARSITHHSLVERIANHIKEEQNRTPNHDAIVNAIALWRDECERVKVEDGITWKATNIDAILERYDILTLEVTK